uniref:Uncharacterized protein n=1 Tax=Arundo donax TaxID=35708 RepID=A0A0A9CWX4_ARUDO
MVWLKSLRGTCAMLRSRFTTTTGPALRVTRYVIPSRPLPSISAVDRNSSSRSKLALSARNSCSSTLLPESVLRLPLPRPCSALSLMSPAPATAAPARPPRRTSRLFFVWCKKMSTAANGTSAAMSEIATMLHVASLKRRGCRAARSPSSAGLTTGPSSLLPAADGAAADGGTSGHTAFTTSPQSLRLWSNALTGNRRSARVPGTSPWRKL